MTIMELRCSPERKRTKTAPLNEKEQTIPANRTSTRLRKKTTTESTVAHDKRKQSSSKRVAYDSNDKVSSDLYENVPVCKEIFDVLSKVGEGTFSKVYLATLKYHPDEMVALKHVVPTSAPVRVANELTCLQELGGRNNIIDVKTTIRKEDHTVFVLPYFPHGKFQDYFRTMDVVELKEYFRNLFRALQWVHSNHVIHRDVKPSNFLYSRTLKRYALVDFGLAMQEPGSTGILTDLASREQEDTQGTQLPTSSCERIVFQSQTARKTTSVPKSSHSLRNRRNSAYEVKKTLCPTNHERHEVCTFCTTRSGQLAPRAGTPGFRSPEVLMKLPNQTTAVDVWSAGIILLSILSGRYPFFKANNDMAALAQIITIFGGKEISRESLKFGKDVVCSPCPPPQDLQKMCERLRGNPCPEHRNDRLRSSDSTRDTSFDNLKSSGESKKRKRSSGKKRRHTKGDEGDVSYENSDILDPDKLDSSNTSFEEPDSSCRCIPTSAYDLLKRCLRINPFERISAEEALNHPFLSLDEPRQRAHSIR